MDDDLDAAAKGDSLAILLIRQPALHEFITSNVDVPVTQKLLALVALALDNNSN